jgi:hypothetical protein
MGNSAPVPAVRPAPSALRGVFAEGYESVRRLP